MARTARTNARRKTAPSADPLRDTLLAERTRRLAARRAGDAEAHRPLHADWLAFEVGGALHALPLTAVIRATPLSRLGATPESQDQSLVGLAADNGRILQVFDLAARLRLAPPVRAAKGYLLVLRRAQTGLRVDARPTVVALAPGEDGQPARILDPASPLHDRMVTPLALETLFPSTPRPQSEPVQS